jgi:hypothetical protein
MPLMPIGLTHFSSLQYMMTKSCYNEFPAMQPSQNPVLKKTELLLPYKQVVRYRGSI